MKVYKGGNGGSKGSLIQISEIHEIEIRCGSFIDALIINGRRYGGTGGKYKGGIKLGEDDSILNIEVRAGGYLDWIRFTTKLGRIFEAGGSGGNYHDFANPKSICVKSGNYVDGIECEIVKQVTEYGDIRRKPGSVYNRVRVSERRVYTGTNRY